MAASVKVGILNDMADLAGPDEGTTGDVPIPGDLAGWLERELAVLGNAGRLDAHVEFVHAYALGFPSGTADAVENAYRQLADAGASLIVGPATGDNALVATPLAEALRIPTINWGGAQRARGRYMFQHPVGSLEEEPIVIARHMAALGCKRLAVACDLSPYGTRLLAHLQDEARILGLEIVATQGVSPGTADALAPLLESGADGMVHLGAGHAAPAVAAALSGWDGPRAMNTAGMRGYHGDFARACDGWFYVDMHSDANVTLGTLMTQMRASSRQALAVARGHDIGRLVAEGLARALAGSGDLSRESVRTGLERVKWLPAAEGHEGTLLGFGIHDRGALHGRYLVMRQWLAGESREVAL